MVGRYLRAQPRVGAGLPLGGRLLVPLVLGRLGQRLAEDLGEALPALLVGLAHAINTHTHRPALASACWLASSSGVLDGLELGLPDGLFDGSDDALDDGLAPGRFPALITSEDRRRVSGWSLRTFSQTWLACGCTKARRL